MNDREEELTEQERYRPNIHLTLNLPICRMMQEGSLFIHNAEGVSVIAAAVCVFALVKPWACANEENFDEPAIRQARASNGVCILCDSAGAVMYVS